MSGTDKSIFVCYKNWRGNNASIAGLLMWNASISSLVVLYRCRDKTVVSQKMGEHSWLVQCSHGSPALVLFYHTFLAFLSSWRHTCLRTSQFALYITVGTRHRYPINNTRCPTHKGGTMLHLACLFFFYGFWLGDNILQFCRITWLVCLEPRKAHPRHSG